MTLDGITLRAIYKEIKDKLEGGKIQKINQINEQLLILNIYKEKNYKLLLSSNSQNARIHLTEQNYENPITPPGFCMVLRKHLQNGLIKEIAQNKLDRTIKFTIAGRDELGIATDKHLVIDIMGKYSNIVLCKDDSRVIEAIKRVSHDMSRVRAVYPGTKFDFMDDGKINVLVDDKNLLDLDIAENLKLSKVFFTHFTGFSPTVSIEICYMADLDCNRPYGSLSQDEKIRLNDKFLDIVEKIRNNKFAGYLYKDKEKISDYYALKLDHPGLKQLELEKFDSISKALDEYYSKNVNDNSLNQFRENLRKQAATILTKRNHKLDLMKTDLAESSEHDKYRIEGDLLSLNSDKIKKGMDKISLLNIYTNEMTEIDLDRQKNVWDNINQKYKISKKYHKSEKLLLEAIPQIKEEISYLINIISQIQLSQNRNELEEIKEELIAEGYLKDNRKKSSKAKIKESSPLKYTTKDGSQILVGRNNKQNEKITLREANKDDYFFHIKDLPGAHVIVKNSSTLNDDLIKLAALLAAQNSKYSEERYVDIDYTQKKNVFKRKGAKPGMVYYNNFQTVRIDLEDKEIIKKMLV